MATAIEKITSGYKYLFEDTADPVISKWLLVENHILFPSLMIVYLLFCTKIGPWYMKDKKPYDLNNIIRIYNFFQVFISAYMVYQIGRMMVFHEFNFKCHNLTRENPLYYQEAEISYIYLIAKVSELLDTVFFVLRKSYRQITFLHLFHHFVMPTACWLIIRWYPGGNAAILGFCNSLVHVVMYSYYLLASYGDEYKQSLWWKKYVTIMQLVQFVIIGLHSFNSLFYNCGYSAFLKVISMLQAIFFFKMFWDFYFKAYLNKHTKKSMQRNSNGVLKNEERKDH